MMSIQMQKLCSDKDSCEVLHNSSVIQVLREAIDAQRDVGVGQISGRSHFQTKLMPPIDRTRRDLSIVASEWSGRSRNIGD